jgi:S-adenosylmethionine:tRNA ribosyltransferase-isomerase
MNTNIDQYDYHLPEGKVALYPADPRDSSKMLYLPKLTGPPAHKIFTDLPDYLKSGDLLVFNNSRVFPARLYGRKLITGGKVEIFLLEKLPDESWEALVRPGRRLAPGTEVEFFDGKLHAVLGDRTDSGGRVVNFKTDFDLMELIWQNGEIPLPPYIDRPAEEEDKERYQTIYAKNVGAVAAPTAGFHFTDEIFDKIKDIGVETAWLTLHPGLGTFRPITNADFSKHKMHAEKFTVPDETAKIVNKAKTEGRRVIAVGTTTVRALETAADSERKVAPCDYSISELFIKPPYEFKIIDGLITNFHLPKSTLLLLVSSLAGKDRVLSAYQEAVKKGYRFYSYGDAMLIL